jgi:anti-sigma B factor antagonist
MKEVKWIESTKKDLQFALSGYIDLGNAEEFYNVVIEEYKKSPSDVSFDCKELDFIDSTTLGTFVKILKAVKSDGYSLKLFNLQPKIKKLFVICSLDSIMEIA